jgi:probable phosphoglycerate mutase
MQGDTGLSKLGVMQAERLRDRLASTHEIAADVLIASTLPRARQTAEIIAPALGLPIILDDEVHELRPGDADGMQVKDFIEKYPDMRNDPNPFRHFGNNGESLSEFLLRVGRALERITHEHSEKSIVITCHGGVIDSSFLYFFGGSTLTLPTVHFNTHNTSITHWRTENPRNNVPNGGKVQWQLAHYNDNFHLRDLNTATRIPWEAITPPASNNGQHSPNTPLEGELQN